MRWGRIIQKWVGHSNKEKGADMETEKIRMTGECQPDRIQKVCDDLGDEDDREMIEMLMENGLGDTEIEEVVKAHNILCCNVMGDLDLEVEKLFAEGVLHKYGFEDVESFDRKVVYYHHQHESK